MVLIMLFVLPLSCLARVAETPFRGIQATGTGFVVAGSGFLLTNEHVVHGASQISVVIGARSFEAEVVEAQAARDLALLKVSASDLQALPLGDSDSVEIGDEVFAIGCPEGHCGTVTQGRIANLHQSATFGDQTLQNLMMFDVTTTHGSSGGPLLNRQGEVVGITMGGIEGTRFGFAIPINEAIALLDRVPGFSTSQMGQRTDEMTLSDIRMLAAPSVSSIQTEMGIDTLLPREVLGVDLEVVNRDTGVELVGETQRAGRNLLITIRATDREASSDDGVTANVAKKCDKHCAPIISPPEPGATCSAACYVNHLGMGFTTDECWYSCSLHEGFAEGDQSMHGVSVRYEVFFNKWWLKYEFAPCFSPPRLSAGEVLREALYGETSWSLGDFDFTVMLTWQISSAELSDARAEQLADWLSESTNTVLASIL